MTAGRHPRTLNPYIAVADAAKAIDFYVAIFGFEEKFRLVDPLDGRIGHAELGHGDDVLMLSDEYPDFGALAPERIGGSPVKLHLYVEDVDTVFARALAAGAIELRPVREQFYGDRSGMLTDPFGHTWSLATQVKQVTPDEMQDLWNNSTEG